LECAAEEAAADIPSSSGTPGWTPTLQIPPGFEAYNLAMTYDSADGYLLLFGSIGGTGPLGGTETWTYAHGVWAQLNLSTSPESCSSSALSYDPVDHYVVYFGGGGWNGGNCTSTDQTWTFSGGSWTQLYPTVSPSARDESSFTNDSADGYLLLFGGLLDTATPPQPTNETWSFVGGAWTLLHPAVSPSARSSSGMTFDAADHYVLLFGGQGGASAGYAVYNDTWSYSAGVWTHLTPTSHPIAPWPDGLAYDASDKYAVYTSAENLSNDEPEQVWTFAAGAWTEWLAGQGNDGVSPPQRLAEVTGYDWADGYFVLFGGTRDGWQPLHDLWSFHGGNWTNESQQGPQAREAASLTYDSADGYLLMFGGVNGTAYLSDTWKWSGNAWSEITVNRTPPARAEAGFVYDASDGYVLMFGGAAASGLLDDTWEYTNGGWTEITPTISPPAADAYETMTYDAADGYVLLVDEGNQQGFTSSWAYHAGVWRNLTAVSGSPTPEPANGVVYDPTDGRVVLFGTLRVVDLVATDFNDTWTFLNGNWTNLTATVGPAPSPRYGAAMTYDANESYVLLFGGDPTGVSGVLDDTWSFAFDHWTLLASPTAPTGRNFAALGYNPPSKTDVLFGGAGPVTTPPSPECAQASYICGDTWQWSSNLTAGPVIERFTATPGLVEVGNSTTFSVEVDWGVTPYSYAYTGLPSGCATANSSQLTCTPTTASNYTVTVDVTDSAHNHTSAATLLEVLPHLTIASFNATPSSVEVGGRTLLSVVPANGIPPVSYAYRGLPPGCSSQTIPTLPCSPGANGTFDITVTATDSVGKNASASLRLTVRAAGGSSGPTVLSFGIAPEDLILGNSTSLFLNATGGNGPLTLAYSGLPTGCSTANLTPLGCTPTASGTFEIGFTAVDPAGVSVSVQANLTVYPVGGGGAALITTFGASPGVVTEGNTTVVTVDASGGTAPLTFSYPSLPPGCRSSNTATLPCTPTAVGTFTIGVVVTDARGNSTGARTTLTVVAGTNHPIAGPARAGSAIPIGTYEWILGGILGLVAAAGLTERVLARRRLHEEGEALTRALSESADDRTPPTGPR
jgi:hypothetical protein